MSKEVRFDSEKVTVEEFEHPNGETGIYIGVRTTEAELKETYDLDVQVAEGVVIMPLKHKADGSTNFESYRIEGDELVVTHTDEQYEQVQTRLQTLI